MNTLVLGLGNLLCSDEGVGVHIVKQLVEHYDLPDSVEVLDGGTSGMDLLDAIAGRDYLVVIDAISADGKAPGSVIKMVDDEVQAFFQTRFSPHQIGLSDVLATLHLSNEAPKHITIIGIVPESLELGLELTPTCKQGSEEAMQELLGELTRKDICVIPKSGIEARVEELTARFRQIGEESMSDLPIYNTDLDVEAIEFQPLDEEAIGILITPWFMNAVVLPSSPEPMRMNDVGQKVEVKLPSGSRTFNWGGDEKIGMFKSLSLYSPLQQFISQDQIRAEARRQLAILLKPEEQPEDASGKSGGNSRTVSRRDLFRAQTYQKKS